MFNYTECPVCSHDKFAPYLECKDYTLSQETFKIVSCASCQFKFTNPIPDVSKLGDYYKAESYISHSDTKQGLVARLYHIVRNYTLKKKLAIVNRNVSRGTILDYGCGTGMFLKTCKSDGWKVMGVEPDPDAAKLAMSGGNKIYSDLEHLTAEQSSLKFNAITLWHVLEHVPALNETIDRLYSSIKEDGVLIIAVPNHLSFDARKYSKFWAAYDVPRHLYHFTPQTLNRLLQGHGFTLSEMLPMKFDSYYVSLLSEKYKRGRTSYLRAIFVGWLSNYKARDVSEYSSIIYIFRKK